MKAGPLRSFLRFLFLLPLLAWTGSGGVLRVACFDFPGSFNPVYATSETAQAVANKVYQALFFFDPQGNIRPELVASYSCNPAGTAITLTLKPGARFADGSVLDSRDVAATIALLRDPRFEYPYAADLDFLARAVAVGPLGLRLELKEKFAPWKCYLTFKVLNADELQHVGAKEFRGRVPMGSGPYRLAVVKEPRGFELARNPSWPGDLRFGRIRYAVLGDPRQAPLKLLNAEVDAVEIHGDDADAYARLRKWRRRFRLFSYRKFGYTYLVFNMRRPAVNRDLRRRAYNRLQTTRFLDDFLAGRGDRVHSPFLLFAAEKPPRPFPVAPAQRRQRLRIMTNSESVLRRQLVLFLCEELKADGFDLEPVFVEYRMFLQRLKQGDFDLAVSAFLLDIDWNMKDILSSSGYFNYAGYSAAAMDAALEAGLREMDDGKRRAIYGRAHDLWRDELPLIPLFNLNYYMGVAREIEPPRERFELIGSCGDFFYNLQGW
jgi:peptide/nickel transport system substrate-binding protein